MSKNNTMVYQSMRPPVAAELGNTPLRGKAAEAIFQIADGNFEDRSGTRITYDQIV
jgi:hypothetical protein